VSFSLKELQQKHDDIDVHWRAYELRPPGSPPMPADYRNYIEQHSRPRFERTAREHYGVEVNSGPFGISSRKALIVAKYAEAQNYGVAYHEAMLNAYWHEGKDISDPAMIKDVLMSIGLTADGYDVALRDSRYLQEMMADVQQAHEYGLSGVPALIFVGKYLVSGAQPYEVLESVLRQVREREGKMGDAPAHTT
jgi:predicted DsbA family dithiol-disulfide isomerase